MIARQKVIVVAVGVNQCAAAQNVLKFAESDVSHFLDRLCERFPDTVVWELSGPKATRDQVWDGLNRAAAEVDGSEAATLIFYFSGHGALVQCRSGGTCAFVSFLLTHDAVIEKGTLARAVALDGREGLLERLSEIKCNKLVILDTCHGGAQLATDSVPGALRRSAKGVCLVKPRPTDPVPMVASVPDRCWVINACSPWEHAYETEMARGGVLTCALLEARARGDVAPLANREMRWPDAFVEGFRGIDEVSLREVVDVARDRIRDMGVPQTPEIAAKGGNIEFKFPRILGSTKPLRHTWTGVGIGPSRPPVPSRIVRTKEVAAIRHFLESRDAADRVLEVLGPATTGKTVAVAAACKEVCQSRDERDRKPQSDRIPLAWISLERGLSLGFLLPFVSYHMITTPEGDARRQNLLSLDLETEERRQQAFERVAALVNLAHGTVVFDNLQILSSSYVSGGDETEVQSPRDRDAVASLIAFLVTRVESGKVVLVATDRRDFHKSIRAACAASRAKQLPFAALDASETKAALRNMGVNADAYIWPDERYTPDSIAQAAYLIEGRILNTEVAPDGIWDALMQDIQNKGYHREAFFLSLFHGTNEEQFLLRVRKAGANSEPFRRLAEMGIVVKEDGYYRVHERIAGEIRDRWRDEFQKDEAVWRLDAAQEYGENAKKEFHLCQVLEARRHYLLLKRHADFAMLLTDRRVYSPLRNWGYCQCAKKWLLEVLERLNPDTDDQGVKRAWFLSALCLLELDRHGYEFSRLRILESRLEEQAKEMAPVLRARFFRTIGEMYVVRREHEVALRWLDRAASECRLSGSAVQSAGIPEKVDFWVESSRIALRLAELFVCMGHPHHALVILDCIEKVIPSRVEKHYVAIARDANKRDIWLSDLCHQMAVAAAQRSSAFLMLEQYEEAREAAADCIVRSLFCRSYSIGDVLGRAVGHVYYARSLLAGRGNVLGGVGSASWHAQKALDLLKRRVLREVCWYTRAYAAQALASCEVGSFDAAVKECDKAFEYLPQRLVPNPTEVKGQDLWHASEDRANTLLRRAARAKLPTYGFYELSAMPDSQFNEAVRLDLGESFMMTEELLKVTEREGLPAQAQRKLRELLCKKFESAEAFLAAVRPALGLDSRDDLRDLILSLATRRLTDPWREAELLHCRAYILRMKYAVGQQQDEEILNAIAFAQYLCLGLARRVKHLSLVGRVLEEAAIMAEHSFGFSDPSSSPGVLMREAARWAERTGSDEQAVHRLGELVKILVPTDDAPADNIVKAFDYVRAMVASLNRRSCVSEAEEVLGEYRRLDRLLKAKDFSVWKAKKSQPEDPPNDERRRKPRIPFAGEIRILWGDNKLDGFASDVSATGMAAALRLKGESPESIKGRQVSVVIFPGTTFEIRLDSVHVLSVDESHPDPEGLTPVRLVLPPEAAQNAATWVNEVETRDWLLT